MKNTNAAAGTRTLATLLGLVLLLACVGAFAAAAEPVGEVTFVSGVVSSQREGTPARFLAKGDPLHEGDVISTSATGYTQISFKDGTRLTLRPNTVFAIDRLSDTAGQEAALFRLVKGGVRALTGLISKRNPRAAQIDAVTATIGIRGTSFDARICDKDCAEEETRPVRGGRRTVDDPIVARIAVIAGTAVAAGRDGQSRNLTQGAALFTGDTVTTSAASYVVIGFRDQSKVTVTANSAFLLDSVRFTGPQQDSGNFAVRVLRGSVRALTGLLGKRDPKSVTFGVTTATIGIRGTGIDTGITLFCVTAAECEKEATFVTAWQDTVDLRAGERTLPVATGQTGMFLPGSNTLSLIDKPPQFIEDPTAPRPDQVEVDFDNLFARSPLPIGPGLYVGMRDGDVLLSALGGSSIPLANGEVGYLAEGSRDPVRITPYPQFLLNDPYPVPQATGAGPSTLLPIDMLTTDAVICEIR